MRIIAANQIASGHPDFEIIRRIEKALFAQCGGLTGLRSELPKLIRQAIDEVIDAPRTGRSSVAELEKTEKTYIGTKVEILVRNFFHLPKGILDLKIDGLDVDVKNTIGNTWMIPREAVGKPCILVASNEDDYCCSFGVFIAHPANLTQGVNQDQKRSVSAAGFSQIHWFLVNEPYPESFWSKVGKNVTHSIMRGENGNERIATLFRLCKRMPIHRDIVQAVAQQKDYMKRLRKNGGARDHLAAEGIAILSGKYDGELLSLLGCGVVSPDEIISVEPRDENERQILIRAEKII